MVIIPQVAAEYYNVMLRNKQTDAWIQANLRDVFAVTSVQPANAAVLNTAFNCARFTAFRFGTAKLQRRPFRPVVQRCGLKTCSMGKCWTRC